MKGFYRKKGGARDLLTKEKERITSWGRGQAEGLGWREEMGRFFMQIAFCL